MPKENKNHQTISSPSRAAANELRPSGISKPAVTVIKTDAAAKQFDKALPMQLVKEPQVASGLFTMPPGNGDNHPASPEIKPFQLKPNNTGLPDNLKSGIENLSGFSMDDVKVHFQSNKPAQLQAQAYAQGTDIHIAAGQEKHLPHEAWHVVQQKQQRVQPTMQMKSGVPINDEPELEREADVMGGKAMQHSEPTSVAPVNKVSGSGLFPTVQRVNDRKRGLDDKEVPEKKKHKIDDTDKLEQPASGSDTEMDEAEITKPLSSVELWKSEAAKLKKDFKVLEDISIEKIALVLMIYRQGIFNPIGEGGNPRYIRSDKNAVIKLKGGGLDKKKNKAGEIPDVYRGITPKEWQIIVGVLGEPAKNLPVENKESISNHITEQRKISGKIKDGLTLPAPGKDELSLMTLIFDGNYPALNIHFPALMQYIKANQEVKAKNKAPKEEIRAGQGKGMTKFLMGRLMNLCNAAIGPEELKLVEQSSFGFQRPTLGDLGTNMSIRLSPGISDGIVEPVIKALEKLYDELKKLMEDKIPHSLGEVKEGDAMHKYWDSANNGPSANTLMSSYNREKTTLNHLLYTQVEKGAKGHSIIGRTLERNHDNILHLANEDKSLKEWGGDILGLHSPEKLAASLDNDVLKAPQLLSEKELHRMEMSTDADSVADQRLALFQAVAESLKSDPKQNEWDEEGSDSEFEDDEASGGKVVVPSGMASLNQLLGNVVKKESNQVGGKMQPGLYYEDFDHAKKNFRVAGYTTADIYIADLNPNITTNEEKEKEKEKEKAEDLGINGILARLAEVTAKVWLMDLTSATKEDQLALVDCWKKNKKAELILTRVSGLKQQELGLNTNPHGLTHWAYKRGGEKKELIENYFKGKRKAPVNMRSKVSNHMRRHFKKQGSYSWGRLELKKSGKGDVK